MTILAFVQDKGCPAAKACHLQVGGASYNLNGGLMVVLDGTKHANGVWVPKNANPKTFGWIGVSFVLE
jgi:hypothetical protein